MAAMPPLPAGATLTAPPASPPPNTPPLPAGAVLTAHPNTPPLPAGAVPNVSQKTERGILSRAGDAVLTATGLKDFGKEVMAEGVQNAEDIRGDFTAPVQGKEKKGLGAYVGGKKQFEKPGVMDYAARVGKTALDIAGRPFVPIHAATKTYIGRPVEELGGPKAETVATAADIALPFQGEIRAALKSPVLMDGLKAFQHIFNPTGVSKASGATEKVIRRAGAEGSLQSEKAAASLMHDNKLVGNLPVPQQRALVDYIENRSKGMTLADPKLQGTADKIAKVYGDYRNEIHKVLPATQTQKFVDDYYVHMWKEKPSVVSQRMSAFARQGSGKNLKARSIPTISDGIKAGLTPITENPIEATAAYAQNMSRFLATHKMQNELKLQGYAKWYTPGSKNVPQGWVPLDGIMTEKMAPGSPRVPVGSNAGQAVRPMDRPIKLYAPPDVARVYNNFISKGLEHGDAGPLFTGARAAANGLTQLKLGLSTFHLATMANEAVTSGFARAFKAASRGDFKTAGKAALTAPAKPVTDYMRGMKMQRELLDLKMPDAMSAKINDAFIRSGGRLKMDPFYRTRGSGSFFNAWEKGTLRRELKDAAEKMYKGTPFENAKGVVDNVANVIQTTAAPLFEKYIPAVKRGAFASQMEDFLRANPKATQVELDDYAVKLADSIDNRFGELVQDNLFWRRELKQAAQIALLSPTWNLGTIREIGGGLKDALGAIPDIAKGKGISDRTAYVAGLATQVALMNGIYTYLKTGTMPHGKDFMAGRTGGTDLASGKPERVQMPGYQKDVYAFGYNFPHHILDEAANKLNPALTAAIGLVKNKDYRGLPIYRPQGATEQPGEPGPADYLAETMLPISLGQATGGSKKGSNIGGAEKMILADRPAPGYITDPQRAEAMRNHFANKDWRARLRADRKAKANLK